MQDKLANFSINFLNRLKSEKGITTDTELAKKLGVKQNTISGWKARNTIDIKLIISVFDDISLDYLAFGRDPPQQINEPQEKYKSQSPTDKDQVIDIQGRYIENLEQQVRDLRAQVNDLKRYARSTPDTTKNTG